MVGGVGEAGEVGVPVGPTGIRKPVRPPVALRVEAAGGAVGDAGDQDVCGGVRPVERALGDRVGEDLAGVEPGPFGAAQHTPERGGAVLGGQPGPLLVGQGASGGELVEPAGRAGGDTACAAMSAKCSPWVCTLAAAAAASSAIAVADRRNWVTVDEVPSNAGGAPVMASATRALDTALPK